LMIRNSCMTFCTIKPLFTTRGTNSNLIEEMMLTAV
jgi:hypothetical protein